MYASYFGLKQEPFSIAPDPRLLFMSERHREALAHLLYGVGGGGGFVLLTGEIGTGKTTVCQLFLEQVPAHCNVAYIFNPKLTVTELLQSVCEEFRIALAPQDRARTVKDYLDPLNAFLLREHAAGRNSVLIIDEAQNLSADVLEQLRLLTNLETRERKLLQIVLIGQPELRSMLARPELEQLAQRVIARYHLQALSEAETAQYVQHRLEVAGLTQALPFEQRALRRIHAIARGVPRRINLLCDRALLGAFAGGRPMVDRAIVDQAAVEVFGEQPRPALAGWLRPAAVLALAVAAGAGLWMLLAGDRAAPARPALAAAPAPAPAVAPVASAPQPPAAPARTAAAAAPALLSDQEQAWRELARAWKLAPGEGDACTALSREQVQCFSRPMTLALIRQLGRPGFVTLDAQTGRPSYALLTALTADSATLRAGDGEQTVTLPALAARWRGEFSTLWRAASGYKGRIADRDSGPPLDWLAGTLSAVDGAPAPAGKPSLDAALKARVLAFQLAQGLPADGRPGPMTFMQLNRVAGVEEPKLQTAP
ncbi:ExeA family protein [Caenimonas terrae]|uniref:ExeA family protein n=1 Tax=Caenimonas terrae TaxID=696074 RepID=A0ABW0N9P9_9BURK